jgi:Tol biopolymer transport system component
MIKFFQCLLLIILVISAGCGVNNSQNLEQQTPPTHTKTTIPIDTIISSPISISQKKIQLTFVTYSENKDKTTVYAVDVGCLEEETPCIGDVVKLFEANDFIIVVNWSPDGQMVAYEGTGADNKTDIFIADWNGENVKNITQKDGSDGDLIWSPNGNYVVFTSCPGRCFVFLADTVNFTPTEILSNINNYSLHARDWFPDGEKFVLTADDENSTMQIFTSNLDGTEFIQLTATEWFVNNASPTISPDGQRIAFARYENIGKEKSIDLILISPDGTGEQNLTNNPAGYSTFSPKWHPDGDWIAISSGPSGETNLYLIKRDGSQLFQLPLPFEPGELHFHSWREYYP